MNRSWIMAVIAVCLLNSVAWGQQPYSADDRPRITVKGESVVNVPPDKIVITLGIETWDADISIAKQKNNEILDRSMLVMKESGVSQREVQTDHLSIQPRWRNEYRNEGFIGYFVRNTLVVTLADVAKVEELVTGLLQAGVNYIHGIDYQTTEFRKYREQARDLALKAAKEKAAQMAAVLGNSIGAPIFINEDYSGSPSRYWSHWAGWGYGGGQGMSQNVVQNVGEDSGEIGDTIALGKISIRAGVEVTFELK